MKNEPKYRCRGDFVLFRLVNRGSERGLIMPDQAAQGKERVVIAIGPEVEGLTLGEKIMVIGTMGEDVVQVPTGDNLFMTRQSNVALVEVEE